MIRKSAQCSVAQTHQSLSSVGIQIEDDFAKILHDIQSLRLRVANEAVGPSNQHVPSNFLCPITHDIMQDPYIVAETGHSYERSSIVSWLASNMTDPKTNRILTNKALFPNHTLRGAIDDFISDLNSKKSAGTTNIYSPCPVSASPPHYIIRTWSHDLRLGRVTSTDAHVAPDLPTAELVRCLAIEIAF